MVMKAMKGCDHGHNRCVGYEDCDFCRLNGFCGEIGFCNDDCEMCSEYSECERPEKEMI